MNPANTIPSPYPHTPNEPVHHSPGTPGQSPQPEVGPREQPIHAPIPVEQPHPEISPQPINPEHVPAGRTV